MKDHKSPLWREHSRRVAANYATAKSSSVPAALADASQLFQDPSFKAFEALFEEEDAVVDQSLPVEPLEVKQAAYEIARKMWRMPSVQRNPDNWLTLLEAARRAKAFDDCIAIADAAFEAFPGQFASNDMGCADQLVAEVVRVAADTRRVAAAWATFDGARVLGFCDPPTPELYVSLLRCCAEQQLPERALKLVDEMRHEGVPRDADVYAALVGAVAEAPQWHKTYARLVDEVLDDMQGDGVKPNEAIYVNLIVSASRCGDARAAIHWFDEMKSRHNIGRRDMAYCALFSALAKAQSVGQKFGTRRRPLVLPPWINLGLDPDQATVTGDNIDQYAMGRYVESTEDHLASDFSLKRRKELKKRKFMRQPVRFASMHDYDQTDGTDDHSESTVESDDGLVEGASYFESDDDDELLSAAASAGPFNETHLLEEPGKDIGEQSSRANQVAREDMHIEEGTAEEFFQHLLSKESENEDHVAEDEEAQTDNYHAAESDVESTGDEQDPEDEEVVAVDTGDLTHVDALTAAAKATQVSGEWGDVTRLRELGNDWDNQDDSTESIRRRQEANIAIARAAFETMECEPSVATLNAYFSVYTEAMARKRAREVAQTLTETHSAFPDRRSNRHLTRMLARRGELGPALESLDQDEDDIETIGLVLDAYSRKGHLEVAQQLAAKLAQAYDKRARLGVGASDRKPKYPKLVHNGVFLDNFVRRRGPPERLLRAFRRLCRERKVDQPTDLPIDPVLWRQNGARLRRSKSNTRFDRHKRALARAGG